MDVSIVKIKIIFFVVDLLLLGNTSVLEVGHWCFLFACIIRRSLTWFKHIASFALVICTACWLKGIEWEIVCCWLVWWWNLRVFSMLWYWIWWNLHHVAGFRLFIYWLESAQFCEFASIRCAFEDVLVTGTHFVHISTLTCATGIRELLRRLSGTITQLSIKFFE